MEHYPAVYVTQPAPLVVVQGLGEQPAAGASRSRRQKPEPPAPPEKAGTTPDEKNRAVGQQEDALPPAVSSGVERVLRVLPEARSDPAEHLASLLKRHDVSSDIWTSQYTKTNYSSSSLVYKFRFAGSKFDIPRNTRPAAQGAEHTSPLSPFNPSAALHPHGLLDEKWLLKYKELLPAVFISVHELHTENAGGSGELTEDDAGAKDVSLATEITAIKNQVQGAGIRFIEVVVSGQSASASPALADRINSIRNMTGLAPRTGLLFLPAGTDKEYSIFVEAVLHLIKPWCFDYYINLEKKFRRKRVSPPPNVTKTTTLQAQTEGEGRPGATIAEYSLDQWDARYSTKLSLANLFHQNNEMSIKHLESAYESLTVLAKTVPLQACHSNKAVVFLWHQTRQLLDILTICIVREYLYLELSNKAYRRFDNHIQNVVSILKNKDINPASYAVSNWLSIQFEWLGELCVMADEYIVPIDRPLFSDSNFGALAMPQPGYIFLQAANFVRRAKAKTELTAKDTNIKVGVREKLILLEKDAEAFSGISNIQNSSIAKDSKSLEIYDYYLSLPIEKQINFPFHQKTIVVLQKALVSFMKAKETEFERSIAYINFQLGEENYSLRNFEKAVEYYEESLSYYKRDHWKTVLVSILTKLINCFLQLRKFNGAVLYGLELAIIDETFFTPPVSNLIFHNNQNSFLDLIKFKSDTEKPSINLYPADETIMPPHIFIGVFLFKNPVLSLSQQCHMQLSLKNLVNGLLFPKADIESIVIEFNGNFLPIIIQNDQTKPDNAIVDLADSDFTKQHDDLLSKQVLLGHANLRFKPKQFKVIHFSQLATKIESNSVSSIILNFNHEKFKLKYHLPLLPYLMDDSFLDSQNNSALVAPDNINVNTNYYINKIPKTKYFWVNGATKKGLSKNLISSSNPCETIIIPRRPKTGISVVNPTNAYSGEIYELKLAVDNKDGEDIGVIFRPLVKIHNNILTSSHNTRPSSKVSSRVTSPRNSLDLRNPPVAASAAPADSDSFSASGKGTNAVTPENKNNGNGGNNGVHVFNLQWNGISSLANLDESQIAIKGTAKLDLKLTKVPANSKENHSLFIRVPNTAHKYFIIKIECSFFTGDNIAKQQESEEQKKTLSTRDTLNIRIPINPAFTYSFGVLPKLRSEDLPNPFLVGTQGLLQSNGGMVTHTRSWCGRPTVKFAGNVPVEVLKTEVEIYTPNPDDFVCDKLTSTPDTSELENLLANRRLISHPGASYSSEELFVTSKKNLQTHANIPVHVKVRVAWKRQETSLTVATNVTESQVWKLVLPLFEPRVLFEVTKLSKESSSGAVSGSAANIGTPNNDENSFVFKYYIENPTSRMFTFSTFIESNENFEIAGYKKDVSQLPVLPFTRQQLKFKAVAKVRHGGKLKIPNLRVYDLYYKVTLPVLLATNEALADRSDIYLRL